MKKLTKLIELIEQLPDGIKSDWKDTNHFELTATDTEEYWWLGLSDLFEGSEKNPCDTELGKRVGLLMDIAEAARAALPEIKKLTSAQP